MLYKEEREKLDKAKNIKKAAMLETKYEFEKKEERLQLEQEQKEVLHREKLKRQKSYLHLTATALFFTIILALMIYGGYRMKQKSNRLLSKQREEIKAQRDALNESNIMKDKFFSIIAHDLKKPFTSLTGFLKVAVTEFDTLDKNRVKKLLATIHNSAEMSYELLENLLPWARSQTGQITCQQEMIDLYAAIESVTALLNKNAETKDISLQNNVKQGTAVFADKMMLETVLRNLLSNGIAFTPIGGAVSVNARDMESHIEIEVADTGVGISEEDLEKLFRIDANFSGTGTAGEKGTGLGLILCREFLEMHGSKIWVESIVGKGSVFRFALPPENPPV